MKLTTAGQAEILRSAQRDEYFKEKLGEYASELLQISCGIQLWIKYKEVIRVVSNIMYETMTTMLNLQTLGEEFTGMVQVNRSASSLPNKYLQFLMILLNNCGKKVFIECLQRCENKIVKLPEDHPLQHSARVNIVKMLHTFRILLPLLEKTHKALFYFNGDYYEVAKRLCSIRYVLVRYWLKDKSSLPAFRVLGTVSIVYVLLGLAHVLSNFNTVTSEKQNTLVSRTSNESVKNCVKCPLCLNRRQDTSVTPCGHLFCWSCIISWLQEQPKCPLCRQSVQPSRVVFLQNYSDKNN